MMKPEMEQLCTAVKSSFTPSFPPSSDAHDTDWAEWAETWASWDPNPLTRKGIKLVDSGKIRDILGARLSFGTAGLRGPFGPGSAVMNDLVVLQTAQGLCKYLLECFGDDGKLRGIVVGYDARESEAYDCSSRSFALYSAAVFLQAGYRVFLYDRFVATPLVAWGVLHMGCCAGVMVTASHNPKNDAGYKVYWNNGAQIISPHDQHISAHIKQNLEPWEQYNTANIVEHANFSTVSKSVEDAYFAKVASFCLYPEENRSSTMQVTYTAMHGVGFEFVKRAFNAFQHAEESLIQVTEQIEPDHNFPTTVFPNPEERGALMMAQRTAEAHNSRLVIANDPDADRLAVAERGDDGDWVTLTGNELGCLLGHWAFRVWQHMNPSKEPSKVYMISTAVSSTFLSLIAEKEGFNFEETLTGFKFMCTKGLDLRAQGFEVIFCFEEAIGYCLWDVVNDKDGVCAAAVFTEMAKQLYSEGKTCLQQLEHLYAKYGCVKCLDGYILNHDPALTRRIFDQQRGGSGRREYPEDIGGFVVRDVRDLSARYDSSKPPDFIPLLPDTGGEMITYSCVRGEENARITLRSSGTEPKIKFYAEMLTNKVSDELRQFVITAVRVLLDPKGHNLVKPDNLHPALTAIWD